MAVARASQAAMLQAIAGASIALIVFQMFIVAAFRTYRYELYRMERDRSPGSDAPAVFRRWSGTPRLVYCAVAWAASVLWVYQLRYLAPDWTWPAAVIATLLLGIICRWAVPPTFRK
jgi:hypothetical protein